jgi:hypothetical protein
MFMKLCVLVLASILLFSGCGLANGTPEEAPATDETPASDIDRSVETAPDDSESAAVYETTYEYGIDADVLLASVPYLWFDNTKPNVYVGEKVTIENIGTEALLNVLLRIAADENISVSTSENPPDEKEAEKAWGEKAYLITNSDSYTSINNLKQIAKDKYNYMNLEIPDEFHIIGGTAVVFKDNVYAYHGMGAEATERITYSYTCNTVVPSDSEEITIYETVVLLRSGWDVDGESISIFPDEISGPLCTISGNDMPIFEDGDARADYLNTLIATYEDSLKTYKHTYKKDSLGEYYWYSTEPGE